MDKQFLKPETRLKTRFGKVWYEGYSQPEFVWQSSAESDDAEPKLRSLVPLIFGTMKGTFYAMLFSIPLAIFGAVYTSQFTSHRFRKSIKPVIEIMGSVPSVVIGFLIALWLAPIVERSLFSLLVGPFVIPIIFSITRDAISNIPPRLAAAHWRWGAVAGRRYGGLSCHRPAPASLPP